MIEKQFFFLSGLPRSGSTVLASILNQNPEIYATPTSPLLNLLVYNDYHWDNTPSAIANPIADKKVAISEAVINGCWEHINKPIIIDKCREWLLHLSTVEKVFGYKPKLIMNVRDIPSILASYLRVLKASNNQPTYIDESLLNKGCWVNDANRVTEVWQVHLHKILDSFRTAYEIDPSYFHIVEYDDLVTNPEIVMKGIYEFLELPNYDHTFINIENITPENDEEVWKITDLHKVNPTLLKVAQHPKDILGDSIYKRYSRMNCEFWRV